MKQIMLVLAVVLVSVTVVSASPIPCTIAGSPSIMVGSTSDLTLTCGALTFDNFQVVFATGGAQGEVDLINTPGTDAVPTYDSVTGTVDFALNPNLLLGGQDLGLMFQVWGGLSGIDLAVGGTNASVSETACAAPIPTGGTSGAFTCPGQSTLGNIASYTGDPAAPVFQGFSTTSPVYVFKDIGTGAGGHLTAFSQSFHVPVPEPVSLVLLGSGLLGLGLLRRRTRKS